MTVKELKEIFDDFVENDFKHLRSKVDCLFNKLNGIYKWIIGIFVSVVLLLAGIILNLVIK